MGHRRIQSPSGRPIGRRELTSYRLALEPRPAAGSESAGGGHHGDQQVTAAPALAVEPQSTAAYPSPRVLLMKRVAEASFEIGGRAAAYLATENVGGRKQRLRAVRLGAWSETKRRKMWAKNRMLSSTCERKQRMPDAYAAVKTARYMTGRYLVALTPYPCQSCWGWHLTSWRY